MAKDIALFNILTNNLLAVAREMSADMLRSAYSTVYAKQQMPLPFWRTRKEGYWHSPRISLFI